MKHPDHLPSAVMAGLVVVFLALAAGFLANSWGRPDPLPAISPVDPAFTNTAPVRLSAAELYRTEGDTSGLECYNCHDKDKPVEVRFDADNRVLLPKEHSDLTLQHGRHGRNNHCFNCHDTASMDRLRTRDGQLLAITDSPALCGSCHGPTLRDWEAGVHGRTSGEWNPRSTQRTRLGCTDCHDPHNPAFPAVAPGPGPQPRHAMDNPGSVTQRVH